MRSRSRSRWAAAIAIGWMALSATLMAQAQDAQPQKQLPQRDAAADAENERLLNEGAKLLRQHRVEEAITQYFDRVIADYDKRYSGSSVKVYSARSQVEALLYMTMAAAAKEGAAALNSTWGDALYLKAYGLVELRRPEEAKAVLNRALLLAPMNAQYTTELGQIHIGEKDWDKALQLFEAAAKAAEFSAPEIKNTELARAWRGQAYVRIELGQLDQAEHLYRQCLALNPADKNAAGQLVYLQSLRAKPGN